MRKKFLVLFLAILGCLACAIGFAACESEPAHVHTLVHKPAVKAICTSNGTVEYWLCTGCNKKFSDESATTEINDVTDPAIGHDYGEWTETKAATCTTEGIEKRYCSHDSAHTQTRYIPALGHVTPDDWIIDTEAACETAGKKHKECTVCHDVIETATIPALGHGTPSDWIIDTEAVCETAGKKHKECTVCRAVVETATIPALEHNYGSYTPNGDATCTADGTETRTCSLCGKKDTRTEENSAHGHSKGKTVEVVGSTCLKQGYTTYSCSVCGENFNTDYQPVLEHDFNSEWVCTLCGYEYATKGLDYSLSFIGGDHYEVKGYYGDSPQVIIPAHYDSLPVTEIGYYAFQDNTKITEVFLSRQITSIKGFDGCTGLTSITIPDSVTYIGGFLGCTGLTSITIPDSVTSINYMAFSGCTGLTSIIVDDRNIKYHSDGNCIIETQSNTLITGCKNSVIPDDGSVTSIGRSAFNGCTGLTSITIPDSVTSIGYEAFSGCTGLTSITIGDGVTSIDELAFSGCTGFTSFTIPNSVTSIGKSAFRGCSSLESITIPFVGGSESSSNRFGYLFGEYEYEGGTVTDQCNYTYCIPTKLKSVTVTGKTINSCAFYNCRGLTSIIITDSVTKISAQAFQGCTGLTSITVPDSVTSIGKWAFSGCSSLESITIPFVGDRIKTASAKNQYPFGYIFGTDRYEGGTTTPQLYCGNSTTSFTSATYYIPTSLKSVTVTGGNILGGAFSNCEGLTSITIPDGVTSIGERAFIWCVGLISINIPDGVTTIGREAFYSCTGLISITIPNSVTSIGYEAFVWCKGLKSITIGNGVTSISEGAFKGCSSLESITIPFVGGSKSASSTFGYIFGREKYDGGTATNQGGITYGITYYIPTKLKSVTVTGGTLIGGYAFERCEGLTSITIPDSVTYIGEYVFRECSTALQEINYGGTKEQWNSISKNSNWNKYSGICVIHCKDGDITKY